MCLRISLIWAVHHTILISGAPHNSRKKIAFKDIIQEGISHKYKESELCGFSSLNYVFFVLELSLVFSGGL